MSKGNGKRTQDRERLGPQNVEHLFKGRDVANGMSPEDVRTLVRNLEFYQTELETQNEELRRAQLALASTLERYREVYDRAPVAYLTLRADGKIMDANAAALRLCAREHDDLEGWPLERIALPEDRSRLRLLMYGVVSTGLPQANEFRVERMAGGFRWVHAEISRFNDGDAPGYRVMLLDVTSRVRSEEAVREQRAAALKSMQEAVEARTRAEKVTAELRLSEERFRLASAAGATLVYELELAGAQRFIVHGLDRVTGHRIEEENLTREWWHGRIHSEDLSVHLKNLENVDEGGSYFSAYRVCRKDGVWIFVEDTGQLMRNETGVPVKQVGTIVDVTEKKNAEDALRDASRRKDEFLATLAHELRNPLAPIRNAVQILRRDDPGPEALKWARDVIDRQVDQMTRLVDDLLDVARITRGKFELRKQPIDLMSVVNDAVEGSRPLIERAGHKLHIEVPGDPIFMDADRTRLAQALMNLLNNAAKYTPKSGQIWLSAGRDQRGVAIRVEDSGAGISRELLPHVFEMFRQGQTSIEQRQGGIGIGLTLVRRLVEMHGGSVEARSEGTGKGSEFIIHLPVTNESAPKSSRGEPALARVNTAAGSARRILVVDDNRDAADSMATFLQLGGHEVRTAHDGITAVKAADEFRPDIILLDIGLPGRNGYDVAREVREHRGPGVMLVAVTGWGQEDDRRRAKESGFDHHLTKPVNFDVLNNLLEVAH